MMRSPIDKHDVDEVVEQFEEADPTLRDHLAMRPRALPEVPPNAWIHVVTLRFDTLAIQEGQLRGRA
jgi:hypothetical protein